MFLFYKSLDEKKYGKESKRKVMQNSRRKKDDTTFLTGRGNRGFTSSLTYGKIRGSKFVNRTV